MVGHRSRSWTCEANHGSTKVSRAEEVNRLEGATREPVHTGDSSCYERKPSGKDGGNFSLHQLHLHHQLLHIIENHH